MKGGITRRRWTAAEDDAIRDQYGGLTAAEIGVLLDRTEPSVWLRARKLGLEKRAERHDPWNEADLEVLRESYGTEGAVGLARQLGRTPIAISQQARVMGLLSRKALVTEATNHAYFSDLATAEQAYVLGLIAADGNVAVEHPRVTFGLQAKDAHLVEWVRDLLNPSAGIYRGRNDFAQFQITSHQMTADLARYGIVPRKSSILAWPRDLGPLTRPFLVGHFDGDGWIHVIKGRYAGWGTCSGSRPFLEEMKEYVRTSTGVTLENIRHRPKTGLWQVSTSGWGAYRVNEWLHGDGYGLARKKCYPEHVAARYRVADGPRRDAQGPSA